mmetsp:Transcript_58957/g.175405  ORF Transcript_58957/g.175405 Transcript_58957/m.175405 type:complete len:234 (-) Transcript_58957:88-789(-)
MPDETVHNILLTASLCMGFSAFSYEFMPTGDARRFNYIAMAMTGFCTIGYVSMYNGVGVIEVRGHDVFWMRYLDWAVSTETFLLGLAMLSGADRWDTIFILAMDAIGVLCALVGALIPAVVAPAYLLGAVVFAAYNYRLFGTMQVSADRMGAAVSAKYKRLTTQSMAAWCVYPVVYLFCEMTRALDETTEVALYACCDVIAKCVCCFLLLSQPDVLRSVAKGAGLKANRALLG